MLKNVFLHLLLLINCNILAQTHWTAEEMASMPEPVTNNAVCEGFYNGPLAVYKPYIFSFGGIDSTLSYSGIHNKNWRYKVLDDTWEQIADLPGTEKTIASSASYINGKIYIMGGYSVASNGSEISSDKVYIYDVSLDSFLVNGANIPIPTDDHVQCVYNDSLIYVVTGWSNSTNITNVQIYDTYNDIWQVGTSVPNSSDFKVFGSNGIIVGDTLYYYGGASTQTNFPATSRIKKGYINPLDPTNITWDLADYSVPTAYRMACTSVNDTVFWIGGSETSYNFDAIAYNGSGVVNPSNQIFQYSKGILEIDHILELPMDIRGVASINETTKYLAGGIKTNGKVSNQLLKLTWRKQETPIIENIQELHNNLIKIQNPVRNNTLIFSDEVNEIKIFDLNGQLILDKTNIKAKKLNINTLNKGFYFVLMDKTTIKKIIIND